MKFVLPKQHLSWSQFDLWRKNPTRYKREYFMRGRRLDTEALRFGKGFALSIEDGSYKETVPDLEVMDKIEYKMKLELVPGLWLLSYLDSYCPKTNEFREYKTGQHAWTKAKVQKHDQLLWYAVMLRREKGKMPERCYLDWVETKKKAEDEDDFWSQVEKRLTLTGKIKTFEREFDERELDRLEEEIIKVATEISEAYQEFIKEI